ncbi:MAG: GTP cyclohydrolase MptA [Actinomycetota bacterium]|nr:GTP cyclohydrolase MptA [Actinomycetota bacterium]
MSETSAPLTPALSDVQAGIPDTQVSLTQVGVRGVEKVIHVASEAGGTPGLFFAELEAFVDLKPDQAGVHMSRFEDVINAAIDDVILSKTLRAEELAAKIAEQVRERQHGCRAEVRITARYAETVQAPESGLSTQEIYKLLGVAVASEGGTRTLTGIEAQGMTACPCAQGLLTDRARDRLETDGFSLSEIDRILDAVPVATHNQRGIGQLHLGKPEGVDADIDARDLLRIVEASMSSEIYELMKRSDEASVVEKAHRNPRFVEDVVRDMVRRVAESYPGLRDGGFIVARQENLETIHRHTVVAERTGLISEVLDEVETGVHSRRHLSRREWLEQG